MSKPEVKLKKKRIKINVTQRDIDAALEDITFGRNVCQVCPVARAFHRHKEFETVSVGSTSVNQWEFPNQSFKGQVVWSWNYPKKVGNWISSFDHRASNGKLPAPFHFYMEVPQCLLS